MRKIGIILAFFLAAFGARAQFNQTDTDVLYAYYWIIYQGDTLGVATISGDSLFLRKGAKVDTLIVSAGAGYWQLRGSSEDTITAPYNVYLDSAFTINVVDGDSIGKAYVHNDSIYISYSRTGDYTTYKQKITGINIETENSVNMSYVYIKPDSIKLKNSLYELLIFPDSTVLSGESIYMPDITSDGGKFQYLMGIDPDGRLFPQPLASGYDSIVEYAIAAGGYGKEDVLDVGGAGEKYTDFSTAVAAAGAGDVVELSSATFTESGTVTMPTGSTLRIYEGGLLSGTFTLVGDNTRLDAGLYQCFGSGVTITGTWIVDKTYVDWFGMIGAAGEGAELTAAINFCKLTTGRTLVFQARNYYIDNFITYWAGGGTIEGNGATLYHTYDAATEYEEFIRIYGSIGTYDTLDANAVYGSYIMTVPAGSDLLNLNRGDLVKLMSDELASEGTDLYGEIKQVDTVYAVGRRVVFTEPIYRTYYASENARMAEITPGKAILRDFKVIGKVGRNYNLGVELKYIDRPVIENVECHNFKYEAFGIQDCYNGRFDVVATNAMRSTGLGYGIALFGANMNHIVTIRGSELRHIAATGGNGAQGGVAYNNLFVNCIGTGVYAHAFDLHKASGTGNKYVNCRVSMGVAVGDTANFKGEWDSGTTYDNDDLVTIASTTSNYSQIYKSAQNANTNHDPATDLGTWWDCYPSGLYGFNLIVGDATIENCEVQGADYGINVTLHDRRNLKVDGLKCVNCRIAVNINLDTLSNSSFNNIQLQNETFKDNAFVFNLANSTLNKVSFSNISGKGAFAFSLAGCTFTDKKLEVNSVVADGLLECGAQTPEVHFNVGSAFLTQQATPGYILNTATTSNGLKSINMANLTVQGAAARPININSHLTSLSFGNVILTDGSTTAFIDNTDSIDRVTIGYLYNEGSGALEILENTGAYCGTLNVYNATGTFQATPWISGNQPTTVNASVNGFIDAIDFKAADLYSGWIKQNGQTLINTYRTANLGLGYQACTHRGALDYNSSTGYNTGLGYKALWDLSTSAAAQSNTAVGSTAGYSVTTGDDNTFVGRKAGEVVTTGVQNTIIGSNAGGLLPTGSDRNIFIGYMAAGALNSETDDKLYIDNTNSATPLIGGDFATNAIKVNGSFSSATGSIADNDATPTVAGANTFVYAGSATAVTITDLDNPTVGEYYTLIGNSDTYTMTIDDSGNFKLSAQWVGGVDDVLMLYCKADNYYIEVSRSNN